MLFPPSVIPRYLVCTIILATGITGIWCWNISKGRRWKVILEMREAQGKSFQLDEILGIGLQLCAVLTYLHGLHPPLIFRDLKIILTAAHVYPTIK